MLTLRLHCWTVLGPVWLLNTARAELSYFESLVHPYAAFSHVWNNTGVMSFQEVEKLRNECAETGATPRDLVSSTLQCACMLAESDGYEWIWMDCCCIDRSSSAELSETINRMYDIYAGAAVCYAYMQDVSTMGGGTYSRGEVNYDIDSPLSFQSSFAQSTWHRCVWSLQALLAPRLVVFVSNTWNVLGTKVDYATALETISGIPASVLRSERPLSDICVGRRLSWAGKRRATRVEDEAYCLLGIMGVTMPIIYGEGRRAFMRLQEAIMMRSPDTTLFAWGNVYTSPHVHRGADHAEDAFLFAAEPGLFGDVDRLELVYVSHLKSFEPMFVTDCHVYEGEQSVQTDIYPTRKSQILLHAVRRPRSHTHPQVTNLGADTRAPAGGVFQY